MPTYQRPSVRLASLLAATAIIIGLVLPMSVSARPTGPHGVVAVIASRAEERAARRAERAQERAARKTELAEERATRRAARAQERAARKAERAEERAARRAARAQQQAARRSARDGSSPIQSTESGTAPAETGASPPLPEPSTHASAQCKVGIEASPDRVTVGETVGLTATLTCPAGVSSEGQQVGVYQRQGSTGAYTFAALGTSTTEADGSYRLTSPALSTNTIFQVRAGHHRARVVVRVAPRVTLSGPTPGAQISAVGGHSHPRTRAKATFTGTVSPVQAGALVALQVAYATAGERWRSVAFGRVDASGDYSIAHAFGTPGEASVRTVVHTGTHNAPAISEPLSYVVSQPQNPQLEIQTSADPISYGASVTITGVAAGAASAPITLLAHTHGGTFAPVATGTTDAGGNYSFTQAPLQNTYYRVLDAAAQSTVLFEGVKFALASGLTPNVALTATAGQQVSFTGTLAPAQVGQVVYLERGYASGLDFQIVGEGTVDATSTYTIVHEFADAGTNLMRIKVPAGGDLEASTGAPFTVTVTP